MSGGSGGVLALLDTLTFPETITILVIALIVLGPEKLPGMARTIGQWLTKLKRMAANLQAEMSDVVDEETLKPLRELSEFATQPKRKLAEFALAAESEVNEEQARAILEKADESVAEGVVEDVTADVTAGRGDEIHDAQVVEPTEVERAGAEVDAPPKVVATGPDHPMERQSPLPPPEQG
jgi:sec-independent protein translocase protein TatB